MELEPPVWVVVAAGRGIGLAFGKACPVPVLKTFGIGLAFGKGGKLVFAPFGKGCEGGKLVFAPFGKGCEGGTAEVELEAG